MNYLKINFKKFTKLAGGVLLTCSFSFGAYKNPSTLIQEFTTLLGPDTCAKIVWQCEPDGALPSYAGSNKTNKIMALDTKDGVVRELITNKGHLAGPTLTWDGKKVIATDGNTDIVYIVNFDGSGGVRKLLEGYRSGGCWQSSDGKQWVLVQSMAQVTKQNLYRINIDDTTQKVKVLTSPGYEEEVGGTEWTTMSVDGAYVAGGFPHLGNIGIMNVSSGSLTKFTLNGCWPTIARDNTYHVLHTIDDHTEIRIVSKDNQKILQKEIYSTIKQKNGGKQGTEYETLRWTPNRDIISLIDFCEACGGGTNIPNPKIVRISNLKYVAINDNPSGSEGNVDVWFYKKDASSVIKPNTIKNSIGSHYNTKLVDTKGRKAEVGNNKAATGILLEKTSGNITKAIVNSK